MPDDIEDILKDLGKGNSDYPADLKSATRAEFTTLVRTHKKGPGCPLFASTFLLIALLVIYIF